MALSHKNVDVDLVCPMCQNMEEDNFHALISCAFSRRIWSSSSFGDHGGIMCVAPNQRVKLRELQ